MLVALQLLLLSSCALYERISLSVDEQAAVEVGQVLVLFERQAMPFYVYKQLKSLSGGCGDEDEISEYARLTGKRCACRMLLFRE